MPRWPILIDSLIVSRLCVFVFFSLEGWGSGRVTTRAKQLHNYRPFSLMTHD